MALEIRVLGPLELIEDGRPIELPASKKTRALLGYLVATARPHGRDRLTQLLFESTDDPRGNLRWSLSKLRGLIGARLVAERDAIAFSAGDAAVDLYAVRAAIRSDDPSSAIALCRGPLLEGLELPDDYGFDQWLTEARHEARELQKKLARAVVDRRDAEAALAAARAWVHLDPADESGQAALVILLRRLGRADEAERQAQLAERRLRAAHPGKFLGALEAARREAPRPPSSPVVSAVAPVPAPSPAPIEEVPLVGRARELAAIDAALAQPHLVLVAGPAGVGRSRLLDRIGHRVRAQGGRVFHASAHRAERTRPMGVLSDALRGAGIADVSDAAVVLHALIDLAPAALLVDDLQWIDAPSAGLLHFLLRADRPPGLVIAAALAQPTDDGPGERLVRDLGRRVSRIDVGPLDEAASRALVMMIDPRLDAAELHAKSQGYPRLLASMARAKRRGEATMTPTVEAAGAAPLEGLDPTALELASWAAVLGSEVAVEDLAQLSGLPPARLVAALGALEAQGVLVSRGAGYAFAHDLFRYSAYRLLSEPRRKLVEAAVAALRRS